MATFIVFNDLEGRLLAVRLDEIIGWSQATHVFKSGVKHELNQDKYTLLHLRSNTIIVKASFKDVSDTLVALKETVKEVPSNGRPEKVSKRP